MTTAAKTLILLLLVSGWSSECLGLDYDPIWEFTAPLADDTDQDDAVDVLIYDASTGALTYRLLDGEYSPPDIGSRSGLLSAGFLSPVPLLDLSPRFEVDETFEGEVVMGSTAIRLSFDEWAYWPWSPRSPEILEAYQLETQPYDYSYGEVLPMGLAKHFLESDIYVASFPGKPVRLHVVPEPGGFLLLILATTLMPRLRHTQRTLQVQQPGR